MDIRAELIGYPRIGPNRELKWALERAWSGRMEPDAFASRIAELRDAHLAEQREAIGSAVDDYPDEIAGRGRRIPSRRS